MQQELPEMILIFLIEIMIVFGFTYLFMRRIYIKSFWIATEGVILEHFYSTGRGLFLWEPNVIIQYKAEDELIQKRCRIHIVNLIEINKMWVYMKGIPMYYHPKNPTKSKATIPGFHYRFKRQDSEILNITFKCVDIFVESLFGIMITISIIQIFLRWL